MPRYSFQRPHKDLPFTGERYVPSVGDQIQHEHFHRYLYAVEVCSGKDVLDIACGEGYGSVLLGLVAHSVVGVDNSSEAVSHATASYDAAGNVTFKVGDVASIPLDDSSVDVVVSFETLEHVDEQEAFLEECRRVLRPDGVLLLSTPNNEVYLGGEGTNEFHKHELSRSGLAELLGARFENVVIGGQRSDFGSLIELGSHGEPARPLYFVRQSDEGFDAVGELVDPTYFVALASDARLPHLGISALLDPEYLQGLHAAYHEALAEAWDTTNATQAVGGRSELDAERARAAEFEQAARAAQSRAAEAEYSASALRGELDSVTASASWRLTTPLRGTKQLALSGAAYRHRAINRTLRRLKRTGTYRRVLGTRAGSALRLWLLRRRAYKPFALAPSVLDLPSTAIGEPDREVVQRVQAWAGRASAVREAEQLEYRPSISLLMPVYNTPVALLEDAVESVLSQSYGAWELILADDGSSSASLQRLLDELGDRDARIRVTRLETNQGISAATNAALALAEGEFVGMLDHDDLLLPDALLAVVRVLNRDREVDAVYTDQEYADAEGEPQEPLLKPDWDPYLFWGVMYVGHLLVVRRSIALAAGAFDSAYDNVQDFEFMLRVSEHTDNIVHVPEIQYRWRRVPGSVAAGGKARANIEELQATAVTAHLRRQGIGLAAAPHPHHVHRAELAPTAYESDASLSVLVGPVEAGTGTSLHPRFASAGTTDIEVVTWAGTAGAADSVSDAKAGAAVSSLHGAIEQARGDLLLFLGGWLTPGSEDWLMHLRGFLELSDVAAVCGVITDRNEMVEEAGWLVEPGGAIGPALAGRDATSDGYAGSLSCARTVSLVSGRCALISRQSLVTLGGLHPSYQSLEYAWFDLSLRARESGLRCVVTPRAIFTRGAGPPAPLDSFDRLLFHERWGSRLEGGDPFHNPNFKPVPGGYAL